MPQARPEYAAGNYYHIYNRGAHRGSIFRGEKDYLRVLGLMKKYVRQFQLAIIAYVLMPNHYHFLVRQDGEKRAGYLPQYVFNSYSKYFNFRHEHSGTLFEGHYKVKLIQSEAYLLHLCRYIHGNPVKDGLVADPTDWAYSNYLEWLGQRDGTLYTPEFVSEYFASPSDYRDFVFDDLRGRDLPNDIKRYLDDFEI